MKHNDYHKFSALIMKAAICLVLAGLSSSCFGFSTTYSDKGKTEVGGILKLLTVPLKDGGQADIRFEKLRRSFRTSSLRFGGAGGEQGSEESHYYLIVRGTIKLQSGQTKEFTWMGPYLEHWSSPYPIPQWLVISGNDVFIEYGAVPMEYQAKCTDVVKRKRYTGTRKWRYEDNKDPLVAFRYTYKWPVEYVWEDVTKGTFEQAARKGVVVSLDSNWDAANDVCKAGDQECYTRCSEQMDGPGVIERRFYYQVSPLNVEDAEKTLNDHPEVICSDLGKTALHNVIDKLDQKRRVKNRDKARRMMALLYRFNADINAVDFWVQTPLQVAVELNVERDIVDEVIRRGGRILYPPCGFREAVLTRYPELSKKDIIREVGEAEGWIDNDGFQVWVESKGSYGEDQTAAKERFIHELELHPRNNEFESDAELKIFSLIRQRKPMCRRKNPATGQEQWLARIAYPGLRDLLNQYHKIKATPYP